MSASPWGLYDNDITYFSKFEYLTKHPFLLKFDKINVLKTVNASSIHSSLQFGCLNILNVPLRPIGMWDQSIL